MKKGDTIASVARRLSVSKADLAEANNLSAKSRLRPGDELLIPRSPTPLLSQRPSEARVARASTRDSGTTSSRRVTYKVRRGDTLSAIARQFQVGIDDIKSWNKLSGTRLTAGDVLTIRASQ